MVPPRVPLSGCVAPHKGEFGSREMLGTVSYAGSAVPVAEGLVPATDVPLAGVAAVVWAAAGEATEAGAANAEEVRRRASKQEVMLIMVFELPSSIWVWPRKLRS